MENDVIRETMKKFPRLNLYDSFMLKRPFNLAILSFHLIHVLYYYYYKLLRSHFPLPLHEIINVCKFITKHA